MTVRPVEAISQTIDEDRPHPLMPETCRAASGQRSGEDRAEATVKGYVAEPVS